MVVRMKKFYPCFARKPEKITWAVCGTLRCYPTAFAPNKRSSCRRSSFCFMVVLRELTFWSFRCKLFDAFSPTSVCCNCLSYRR